MPVSPNQRAKTRVRQHGWWDDHNSPDHSQIDGGRAIGCADPSNAQCVGPAAKRTGAIFNDIRARVVLQDSASRVPVGSFESKELFVTMGLGLLPAYWYYCRRPHAADAARTRVALTTMVAFIVWWASLVGHV